MRIRTILFSLLSVYALVSTAYFVFHLVSNRTNGVSTTSGRPNSTADLNLPVAPPFGGTNPVGSNAPSLAGNELMARVQIENELRYTDLQSFVCRERMDRFKSHLNGENPRQIDTVTSQVSFENGVENYSAVQQNNKDRQSLASIPGAWSMGEFGTLLRQTRTLLTSQALTSKVVTDQNGGSAVLYSMDVPGAESPWELIVEKNKYRVPFITDVLVSSTTGRILRIQRTSTAMPPAFGISEIQWAVNLKPIPLDGKEWLLPTTGEYTVLYPKNNRREWNSITFADYHRYTASSVMHF